MAKAVTWKCPKCKMQVTITGQSKTIKSSLDPQKAVQGFPTHSDCELARPIKKMDFTKLTKVREG